MSKHIRVAILGAPGTGKATLAAVLRPAFSSTVLQSAPVDDGEARQHRQHFDLTLLTGLDLPPNTADRSHYSAMDQALRDALDRFALPYALIYGLGEARYENALLAIRFHLRNTDGMQQPVGRWRWACEKCSDPDCEHQLFRNLLRDC